MANEQNLIRFTSEQSREEARINGRKGGIASGEAKRRKKTMMEMFELMLTKENDDPAVAKSLKKLGFEETDNAHMAKIVTSVMRKAEDGDLKAVELLTKLVYGDTQSIKVSVDGELSTKSRVQIYLPERDEEPE